MLTHIVFFKFKQVLAYMKTITEKSAAVDFES